MTWMVCSACWVTSARTPSPTDSTPSSRSMQSKLRRASRAQVGSEPRRPGASSTWV